MNRYFASILIAASLLQGCSAFSPPTTKPVIEDRISQHHVPTVGVLATTPERRVVLVKMPDNKFCAEPPADAADNISSALSAMAKASTKGTVGNVQLGIANTLATSVKQLFVRSQGVQLYRDGTFMLCAAYLNGAISQADFLVRQEKLLDAVVPLIIKEIPYLHRLQFDDPDQPAQPSAEAVDTASSAEEKQTNPTAKGTPAPVKTPVVAPTTGAQAAAGAAPPKI
jgi:hypothetical protein